jgi:hypothetical protein
VNICDKCKHEKDCNISDKLKPVEVCAYKDELDFASTVNNISGMIDDIKKIDPEFHTELKRIAKGEK